MPIIASAPTMNANAIPIPYVPLGILGASVVSAYSKLARDKLEPFELTPLHWAILDACFQDQADTITSLTQVLPLDPASISRIVETLVKKGLLQRRRLSSDRRVVKLSLTKEGLELMPELGRRLQAVDSALLKGVSEEERLTFMRVAQMISANSEAVQETESG